MFSSEPLEYFAIGSTPVIYARSTYGLSLSIVFRNLRKCILSASVTYFSLNTESHSSKMKMNESFVSDSISLIPPYSLPLSAGYVSLRSSCSFLRIFFR